jgi:amino acid adenylation domain-containing protein
MNDTCVRFPLTSTQGDIYFDQLHRPSNPLYNVGGYIKFGKLDVTRLAQAHRQLVTRHDAFGIRIRATGSQCEQSVVAERTDTLAVHDFSGMERAPEQARMWIDTLFQSALPCEEAELFRAALLKIRDDEYWYVGLAHHIIMDGWGFANWANMLGHYYKAPDWDDAPALPWSQIVDADLRYLGGKRMEADRSYWLQQFPSLPDKLLPCRTHGAEHGDRSARAILTLTPEQWDDVHRTAVQLGVGIPHIFSALLCTYVCSVYERQDFILGMPLHNRNAHLQKQMIGVFASVSPLRVQIDPDLSFARLVQSIADQQRRDMRHQRYPFGHLLRDLGLQGGRGALYDIAFNYLKLDSKLLAQETAGQLHYISHQHEATPLTMTVWEFGDAAPVEIHLDYNLACFDAVEIGLMSRRMSHLLDRLPDLPGMAINTISVAPPCELDQLLHGFNDTTVDYPHAQLVHQLVETHAASRPTATALVFEQQRVSYAELNQRANHLAHYLISLGVGPDDRVAICIERNVEMMVGLLGILKSGAAYVPMDPLSPPERLAFMLGDCAPAAVLVQQATAERLPPLTARIVRLESGTVNGAARAAYAEGNPDPLALGLTSRHLAYVIYTSGSTGEPKGVMVEHASLYNLIQWHCSAFALSSSSRSSCVAGIAFDASAWEIWPTLSAGGELALPPSDSRQDPQALLDWWAAQPLDVSFLVTPLAEHALASGIGNAGLKTLLTGGDRLHRLPEVWPAFALINNYGPTETTVVATSARLDSSDSIAHIGRPIANTRIYILNARGQPAPIGVCGELYVAGAGVARGYLNRPALNAERFVPDRFSADPEARLYKTGDLARWLPDGNIEYIGRNDDQVKLHGHRIELGEVGARLGACEGVREALVLVREERPGEPRLVAYLTLDQQQRPSIAALRSQLASSLPAYMLPSSFVVIDAFPLTLNGKYDRDALPPPDQASDAACPFVAPEGQMEQRIARIWQELLGIDKVGRDDHFFELGGHSLLAVQVASRLRQECGIEIGLRELFAEPVLSRLASIAARANGTPASAIPAVARSAPLALSWAQQGLYFLQQLDAAAGVAYHMPAAMHLRGTLDDAALRASLDRIVARHEVLRTRFVDIDGVACQIIGAPDLGFALAVHDLRALHGAEKEAAVARLRAHQANDAFDLATGPLMRGQLLRLADDEHILLVTLHHIVSDGWSIGVLIRELNVLYKAFSEGRADPLAPLAIQYADYAAWQHQRLQGELLHTQRDFWRTHLSGAPALLSLPTDRPRPALQSYAGDSVALHFSPALSAGLRALAQRHGATLFMTLLAGWAILLARLAGQDQVVVGTPVANRQRREVEDLIGFFVNTLALRVRLDADPSVAELLAQVKRSTLDAHAHQDLPFEQVVEALRPERSRGHSPLFQVMFSWNNTPQQGELSLHGLAISRLATSHGSTQFDLSLAMSDSGGTLGGTLGYASDLFERASIERLAEQFQCVLSAMVADAQQRCAALALMSKEQERQLLDDFNDTATDYPQDVLLHQLFEAQAAKRPDDIALVFEDRQLTYAQLNARANELAHHLRGLGVGADVLVGVCIERSFEMLVGLLGILKAGGAYVPLDPGYPAERLAYMLADCAPAVLLTQQHLLDRLPETASPRICLDTMALAGCPAQNPPTLITPDNLAYVIYTSGSTGQPKGAMNQHDGIVNRLLWAQQQFALLPADRVLQKTPFSFDVSVWELFLPLLAGAQLVLARPGGHQDPDYLAALIERRAITVVHFVPSMLQAFITQAAPSACHSIRHLLCSGEALPYPLQARVRALLPHTQVHNLYGPTEAAVDVSYWQCAEGQPPGMVPIGRPIANTRMYILDPLLQPVPQGVRGEIHIGGIQVGRGYLNRPDLTAERFIADPFSARPGARLYKTGDLGRYLADGNIEYLGRNDFQLKIRGFRIEPGEIEAALGAVAGVREALVMAREDRPGGPYLVAYLLVQPGHVLETAMLRARLAKVLAEHMLPSAFVTMDSFPLTPSGKLDRRALPAPDQDGVAARAYHAPQGASETAIARIWQDLLKLDRVGRDDNFFELGGHSLLALQCVSRLRQQFGVDIALRDIFDRPCLCDLASCVAHAVVAYMPPISSVGRDQPMPLSLAQQRLWFLDRLDRAAGVSYHMPAALRLEGTLNLAALRASMDRIVARHENLRTTFVCVGDQPTQAIAAPDLGFALGLHDLRAMHGHEQQAAVARIRDDEACHPFDLALGPLLRGQLVRLADDVHILLVTQHHIISDGWSVGVMIEEVSALYSAFSKGLDDPLAPLAIQYADFAAWQRQWLQGEVLQTQTDFWRTHLTGAPALLTLPTDRARPARQSYAGASVALDLPAPLSAGLRALAQRHGVTLFMTLLAGWSVLLARLAGQDEVVIGTPVANRRRHEIDALIGFFVNTLALRVRLDTDPSVADLLAQVKRSTVDGYAHQDLPFEQVVEALKPARSMGYSPLFQAMFAWNNTPGAKELVLPGLTLTRLEQPQEAAHFDLSLNLADDGDAIGGHIVYASALFEHATVQRFAGYFQNLLAAMVADPQQQCSRLALLTSDQRHGMLTAFNPGAAPYPHEQLVHQLFERQAASQPDALAVVYEGQSLTYSQLNRRANQLAHRLLALGAGPDTCVALYVERSVDMLVGLLGILKAGAAYVPIDPAYPRERLAHMLRDSTPLALVTQASLRQHLDALGTDAMTLPVCLLDGAAETGLHSAPTHNPDPVALGVRAGHMAYVIYTSGSTGASKGVMVEHRSLVNFWTVLCDTTYAHCPRHARVALNAAFSFDMSLKGILQLLSGHCVHIIPQLVRANASALLGFLQEHRIDAFDCTPSQLELLLDGGLLENANYRPVSVLIGGEAIGSKTWEILRHATTTYFYNMYGPTECTIDATVGLINGSSSQPHIGRPVANAQVYILDRHLEPVPVGVCGELYIGGAGVARGYLKRDALTAERFLPSPFADVTGSAARIYKTGDLGSWMSDGTIAYLGRNDFQVKIRGFRIELGEIEASLAACAGVREARVIAREDSPGDQRLVAYLVAASEPAPAAATLRATLEARLPAFMVPAAYVFLNEFPLTSNGKLDRNALAPPDRDAVAGAAFAPPQGEVETTLCQIWQELLGLDQVGRHDNFFNLGGHSMLAVQLVSRIRTAFAVELPLAALFETPTLCELAAVLISMQLDCYMAAEVDSVELEIDSMSESELLAILSEDK